MIQTFEQFTEKLKGGEADGKTLADIADMHNVSVKSLEKEMELGLPEELEHTDDKKVAEEIVEGLSVELGLKKPYKKREQKAA
jgi:hypothetical protein